MKKRPIKILFVEDELIVSISLSRILAGTFEEVITADDGVKGLQAFQKNSPNIVLTDIRMPKMDGLELSKRIKFLNPKIPIIGITASNEEETLSACRSVGMTEIIIKPLNATLLISKILQLLPD
ncbi:response regulator receiver domain protein [Leptospira broomii serovar Hurstbridge str. 5399]|uniref:Response regulator receiver domain protein n=1 Tax=Leptospira broomii serovar Hurstbridge str. 5399 TaxID=1049789 RepID=T0FBC7_9LEPT|nr:response regulator [Leptospira broomii]EQA45171.1 response regulator receiver domain protein [Leptospira broomii serovar Hurstbridge str. 5399]